MEYNIGDKIVIKEDLKFKNYDVVPSMTQYCNKIAKIINKQYNSFNKEFIYQIDLDCGIFNWYEEMFEPYEVTKIVFKTDANESFIVTKKDRIKIKYFEGATKLKINPKGNCIDVYAREDIFIPQFEMKLVPLGFAMELPKGKIARLFPRSSTFKTWGVIQVNSVGIIDESYCGDNDEWKEPLLCIQPKDEKLIGDNGIVKTYQRGTWIRQGDKIAQFEIVDAMIMPEFEEVEYLNNKDRNGFGSTGDK